MYLFTFDSKLCKNAANTGWRAHIWNIIDWDNDLDSVKKKYSI